MPKKQRLIDANLLWKALDTAQLFDDGNPRHIAQQMVEEQPTVDAVKVRHGKWIPLNPNSDVRFYCSECETEISTSWDYDEADMWAHCPRCGARMDGKDDG